MHIDCTGFRAFQTRSDQTIQNLWGWWKLTRWPTWWWRWRLTTDKGAKEVADLELPDLPTQLTYPSSLHLPIIITFRPDRDRPGQTRPIGLPGDRAVSPFLRRFCSNTCWIFCPHYPTFSALPVAESRCCATDTANKQKRRREVFVMSERCFHIVLHEPSFETQPFAKMTPQYVLAIYINADNNGTNMDPAWIDNCGKGKINKKLVNPL